MSKVQIVPNKDGKVVSAYKSNPEFGYIQLQQNAMVIDGGWVRNKKKSCLLRAEMTTLEAFLKQYPSLAVPGNIVTKEFLESEVPADMAARFIRKDGDYEDNISGYIKRAGADGEELTVGGERILRFSFYDPTGQDTDIRVQHDVVTADAGITATATTAETENTAF